MSRAYTVAELDALRRVMESKFLWGRYRIPASAGASRNFMPEEKIKTVEEYVRTAMLAGHTAEDYLASE